MKRFSIILNVILLIFIAWQAWTIGDVETQRDMFHNHSNYWHNECAHWKIHGKGTPKWSR